MIIKNSGKKITPFFSHKGLASSNIVLKGNGDLITDNKKIANLFNTCFINITDFTTKTRKPMA